MGNSPSTSGEVPAEERSPRNPEGDTGIQRQRQRHVYNPFDVDNDREHFPNLDEALRYDLNASLDSGPSIDTLSKLYPVDFLQINPSTGLDDGDDEQIQRALQKWFEDRARTKVRLTIIKYGCSTVMHLLVSHAHPLPCQAGDISTMPTCRVTAQHQASTGQCQASRTPTHAHLQRQALGLAPQPFLQHHPRKQRWPNRQCQKYQLAQVMPHYQGHMRRAHNALLACPSAHYKLQGPCTHHRPSTPWHSQGRSHSTMSSHCQSHTLACRRQVAAPQRRSRHTPAQQRQTALCTQIPGPGPAPPDPPATCPSSQRHPVSAPHPASGSNHTLEHHSLYTTLHLGSWPALRPIHAHQGSPISSLRLPQGLLVAGKALICTAQASLLPMTSAASTAAHQGLSSTLPCTSAQPHKAVRVRAHPQRTCMQAACVLRREEACLPQSRLLAHGSRWRGSLGMRSQRRHLRHAQTLLPPTQGCPHGHPSPTTLPQKPPQATCSQK